MLYSDEYIICFKTFLYLKTYNYTTFNIFILKNI